MGERAQIRELEEWLARLGQAVRSLSGSQVAEQDARIAELEKMLTEPRRSSKW